MDEKTGISDGPSAQRGLRAALGASKRIGDDPHNEDRVAVVIEQ